ncbi:MAG: Type 1 glutamine amidotransferase-like domain-containing protein [Candidatus Andersenbacteria bacterium]|nr:Type 1 glutamine amidotransferase-like domain-containing protein [Candidatus Andersenbacteria bacterium]MBI3274321.1 Type 1 glutamine amidotransferase-like domain-containing protein [Candidatus Colwellbacteria bacterium]
MKKIVAISGGEIGRPGHLIETTKIDKEIIRLTGKKHPKLLFVPTASEDDVSYYEVVKKHFGKRLGCETDVLYLIKRKLSMGEIEAKVLGTDIIYVGGGNTQKMMKAWKRTGFDKILKKAYEKGVVLSGVSAGAVCWFKWANSDSRKSVDPTADFIRIPGLGFVSALYCPHYDVENDREPSLKEMMKKVSCVGIAVDNCCAIEIVDDKYRVFSSKSTENACKVYWKGGKYFKEKIEKRNNFQPLADLLKK